MTSINDFLDNILSDFKDYLYSGQKLCKLHDAHFDAGKVPDYSDINIQQLYLLRYAYAYAFEYKYMYGSLLHNFPAGKEIDVTSVGCGSMIDYWSLAKAVDENCIINYRGIDTIEWYYNFPSHPADSVGYYCENAVDFFQNEDLSSDIYIFPKSISEFSLNEINQISSCFSRESILKDRISFMFSLRTDQGSMQRDMQKTETIFNRLVECGFQTTSKRNGYYQFDDSIRGKTIRSVDSDFSHPGDVIDCLKELYCYCPSYKDCIKQVMCKNRLGRFPILKCSYAAWQTFTFERM